MERCFDLAVLGAGAVSPNPMVGAVIVYNGKIIGEGLHQQYGGPHAEVHAVQSVKNPSLLPHSTLYCSLEPCYHFGKTPPCVDLIIEKKIPRVVISNTDPNPKVAGQSIEKMRAHGIEVTENVLAEKGAWINRSFFTWIKKQRPHIILKWAQSRDGFIGKPGEETAISGPATKRLVHRWRAETDAILVGTQTALTDNPQLNNRFWGVRQPLRIALDFSSKIPSVFHLLDDTQPTWIIGPERPGQWSQTRFSDLSRNHLLPELLAALYQEKKSTLLVEGGASLLYSFIINGLWDEIRTITNSGLLGAGIQAPEIPFQAQQREHWNCGADSIEVFTRK